jgi:hypothetical protein
MDVTLGADPEFGLLKRGQLAFPSNVSAGMAGTDKQFASDGCGRIAELRPDPSVSPTGLVTNIYNLMKEGLKNNPAILEYKWKAGSMAGGEPLGGHIHIGHPSLRAEHYLAAPKSREVFCRRVCNALDKIVAPMACLIEDPIEAADRRLSSSYGGLGNWRGQTHGMEYRPLASWLTSPKIAAGILSIVYCIMSEIDSPGFLTEAKSLPKVIDHDFKVVNRSSLMGNLEFAVPLLRKTAAYKKYMYQVEYIILMIEHDRYWGANNDMKKSWGIVSEVEKSDVQTHSVSA